MPMTSKQFGEIVGSEILKVQDSVITNSLLTRRLFIVQQASFTFTLYQCIAYIFEYRELQFT